MPVGHLAVRDVNIISECSTNRSWISYRALLSCGARSEESGHPPGHSTKFYTDRLFPEVQTLTILKKGACFCVSSD